MKKIILSLFTGALIISVSAFAGEKKLGNDHLSGVDHRETADASATLEYLNSNYTEIGHYQNSEVLRSLEIKYAVNEEVSFARAYRNDTEIKLIMMKKSGKAMVITTKVKKNEGPWCECFTDGVAYDPTLGSSDPWQCTSACDEPGPGKK